jgi:hypothetical protein
MATDTRKIGIGAFLLLASTAIILGTGQLGSGLHPALGSLAALGLAAGALLVGTSEGARPV